MAVTRIKNNQITDATVVANAKLVDYSISSAKLANNLTYNSNFTVAGNLTVQGNTTQIDTTITTIEDPVIVLASTQTTGTPVVDIGYLGYRGDQSNIAFVWDESAEEFVTVFTSSGETNTTVTITSYANFHTNDANIGGNIVINGTTSLVGNLTSANVTGTLSAGNLSTTGVVSATGTVTGGNVATAGTISATGNITGGNLLTGGLISASGTITSADNISGANLLTGGAVSATGTVTGGNVATGGTVSATGTVTGGNVTTAGQLGGGTASVTGNITGGNLATGGTVSATGNVTGGNLATGGTVSATGNVTGGNILFGSGIVSGTGNIYADNIFANISGNIDAAGNINEIQFNGTGDVLAASAGFTFDPTGNVLSVNGNISGANLLTGGTVSATGTVTGGNVATGGTVSATGTVTGGNVATGGTVSATGDVTGGNVTTTGTVSATGTVTGGNVTTTGTVSATGTVTGGNVATGGTVSATGTVTGGNVATGGTVSATGNITGNYFFGNGSQLTGIDTNLIKNGDSNVRILTANGNITMDVNGTANVVIITTTGIETNTITATGNVTGGNLLSGGLLSVSGNITGANISTSGTISATGTATAGNFDTGGNVSAGGTVSATGNITGGNVTTAGIVSATGTVTGGNVATGGTVSATGNITGGNILTMGLISASGTIDSASNITGANLLTAGDVSATGNLIGNNVNTDNVYSSGSLTLTAASGDITLDSSGNIDASNNYINNVSNPVQAQDAATKQYVDDAVSAGIQIHQPVYLEANTAVGGTYAQGGNTYTVSQTIAGNTVVFSTAANLQPNDQLWFSNSFQGIQANVAYFVVSAPNTSSAILSTSYDGAPVSNITSATGLTQGVRVNSGVGATLTNSGANVTLVVDGVTTSNGDRILIYSEANAVHNGVYVVSEAGNATTAWQLTRSSDTNTYGPKSTNELDAGDYFFVQSGDSGAGESYVMTAPIGPFIIGYDNLTFTQFSASQVYTANTSAGLSLTGTVFSAKVDNNTTAFDGGGNIVVKAGANLTTPNIGAATGTSLSLTGTATVGNVSTGGTVSATGDVTGGNVVTSGLITATGNITGNYFIGNGSQLTGVTASSVDANNLTGNTLSSNVTFSSLTSVGTLSSLSVAGTTTSGNLVTGGTVSATGNITGGNIDTAGLLSGGNVTTGGTVSATGDVTGGNVATGGTVSATGTVTGGNVTTTGTVSATGTVTGGNVATGGTVSATGTVTGGNVATAGTVSATGNITGGNILTGGLLSATSTITSASNISGGNLLTGGEVSATGTVTGGNVATGGTVSATGNITGGNILTGGLISSTGDVTSSGFTTTGNVTGGNILFGSGIVSGTGNVYAANFIGNISGNIDAAGNINEVQFNGTGDQLDASAGFTFNPTGNVLTANGNINGANLFTGGTVSATGNLIGGNVLTGGLISATGNITGNYFFGNGSQLTGIDATSIQNGNSNVRVLANANVTVGVAGTSNVVVFADTGVYVTGVISATGNITGGNIDTAGLITATGNIYGGNLILAGAALDTSASRLTVNSTLADADFAVNGGAANVFYIDAGANTASFGSSTQVTNAIVNFATTTSVKMPVGNTIQRPGTGVTGMVRFNTTLNKLEIYDNSQWSTVGDTQFTVIADQQFNGDGSTVAFTLSSTQTTNSCIVSINGVVQIPTLAYSVSGTTLTFTEAPLSGDLIDVREITTTTTVTSLTNVSGNASVSVSDASPTVLVTGDLSVTGNVNISGNVATNQINNGTSAVQIPTSGGNVNIDVGAIDNMTVFTETGAFITGNVSVTGNVTAQDVNSLSDVTLKTNIQPISGIESVLFGLNGYEYDWKNGSGHSYGFLAQEVEKVLPNAVKTGQDGLKAINYMMIIPFLVETIKQMGSEIKDLKQTVSSRGKKK